MCDKLAEETGVLLREAGLTLAVAESATGGLISSMITDIPGSSNYFNGGVVSYTNEVKKKILGVKIDTLNQYGAVSPEIAAQMADGIRKLMKADIGLSDSGIAGPDGGTSEKPVGLFYIGLSSASGTVVEKHIFSGNRLENKRAAAEAALVMLKAYFLELRQ